MTTTVRRWTSMLRSLRARSKRGTRTARAGALTSATKVVFESDLMHAGTESGFAIHLTRVGIWGIISAFSKVVHSVVAHLLAAVDTYYILESEAGVETCRRMHLGFSIMHSSFHLGQGFTKLVCDLGFGGRNEALKGI